MYFSELIFNSTKLLCFLFPQKNMIQAKNIVSDVIDRSDVVLAVEKYSIRDEV